MRFLEPPENREEKGKKSEVMCHVCLRECTLVAWRPEDSPNGELSPLPPPQEEVTTQLHQGFGAGSLCQAPTHHRFLCWNPLSSARPREFASVRLPDL
jgi:hypothetical protein